MINITEILLKLFMLSVFTPLFYFPYVIAVLLWSYVVLKLIIIRKLSFYKGGTKDLLILGLVFIIWAVISWAYNFFIGNVDFWSIFFWLITYSFPLWVIFFISLRNTSLDFEKMFHFYKKILLLEFCIGIVQALLFKDFAGDHIKGTCMDSHTLGLQYAIALIVLFIRILYLRKRNDVFYFFIFLIGMIMTGYTSNIVFLILVLLLIFFDKTEFFTKISVKTVSLSFILLLSALFFLTMTKKHGLDYVLYGINSLKTNLENIEKTPLLGKIYSYKLAFKEITKEIDIIFGLGPASYTSRAAQMRNPDVATRKLFIDIPSYKNEIFEKYIFENFYKSEYGLKKYSWGTLASPMTSIISTWVELGIIGMFLFVLFFWRLFKVISRKIKLSIISKDIEFFLRLKAIKFILVFFIIDLFYLNYWEYPQMTIPVFVFYFLGIKNVE
jgi:hypothetical protein